MQSHANYAEPNSLPWLTRQPMLLYDSCESKVRPTYGCNTHSPHPGLTCLAATPIGNHHTHTSAIYMTLHQGTTKLTSENTLNRYSTKGNADHIKACMDLQNPPRKATPVARVGSGYTPRNTLGGGAGCMDTRPLVTPQPYKPDASKPHISKGSFQGVACIDQRHGGDHVVTRNRGTYAEQMTRSKMKGLACAPTVGAPTGHAADAQARANANAIRQHEQRRQAQVVQQQTRPGKAQYKGSRGRNEPAMHGSSMTPDTARQSEREGSASDPPPLSLSLSSCCGALLIVRIACHVLCALRCAGVTFICFWRYVCVCVCVRQANKRATGAYGSSAMRSQLSGGGCAMRGSGGGAGHAKATGQYAHINRSQLDGIL